MNLDILSDMEINIFWVYAVGLLVVLGIIISVISNKSSFKSGWFKFSTDNTRRRNQAKSHGNRNKIAQGKSGHESKNIADVEGDDNEITQQ